MENFIVSARKYRPVTFDTVVGQTSITTTLKNAIKNNHLAQAYLFCGPRGVGKTTCARIFAKTINCSNITPQFEACNECESCKSFNESRSYCIHELDAASNNSVEDIRLLIDKVRIPPQIGKYSIYIIDEVHMLSSQAFNAFLKTLEEPPKHAIFVLATTEKYKIIPTILSRCQIFDFNRISIDDMVQYLAQISQKESIESEPDALNIIAQKADGAMRDALSIFDQIVSFSGDQITYKTVIENLNILDYDYYFKLTNAFLNGHLSEVLLLFNEILMDGFDAHNFIVGLSKHFRDVLVSFDPETIKLLEVGVKIKEKYLQQASVCTPGFIIEALSICNTCDINYKSSRNQRLHVELALVKLSQLIAEKKKSEEPVKTQSESEISNVLPRKTSSPSNVTESVKEKDSLPVSKEKKAVFNSGKPLTTSIKSILKEGASSGSDAKTTKTDSLTPDKEDKDDEGERVDPLSNIDLNQLVNRYNEFVESIRLDRPRMYNSLQNQTIQLTDERKIQLIMSNSAQIDDFNKNIKTDLVNFLNIKLNDSSISVNVILEEQQEKKIIYTAEDKFQHLINKNPELLKLKQQFNLDFE